MEAEHESNAHAAGEHSYGETTRHYRAYTSIYPVVRETAATQLPRISAHMGGKQDAW